MATRVSTQIACVVALLLGSPLLGAQHAPPPAYQRAAQATDVPVLVLYAVALQESGWTWQRHFVPWPWTLNIAGEPHRFNTRAQACSALTHALIRVPAKRIDVGLGQLNVGFQGHRVAHPCQLLDPYRNLKIAATILREHHTDDANWLIAAGRYHRPAGGKPASEYRRRIKQHLTRLSEAGPAP
jgi:hypothetical protein